MPKILLAVPHLRQRDESDCLPACAQMVLVHLSHDVPYERLLKVLGTRGFGTPAENILRLDLLGVRVTLEELSPPQILDQLHHGRPVIAFVRTADLPYWSLEVDHAVVVVGIDEEAEVIYLNDPAMQEAPQAVPLAALELAMQRFDYRCAIIQPL